MVGVKRWCHLKEGTQKDGGGSSELHECHVANSKLTPEKHDFLESDSSYKIYSLHNGNVPLEE